MSVDNLIQVFREEFEIAHDVEVNSLTNFREVISWSSMNSLVVIILLENEYDVIVTDEALKAVNTFQELYDLVISKKERGE